MNLFSWLIPVSKKWRLFCFCGIAKCSRGGGQVWELMELLALRGSSHLRCGRAESGTCLWTLLSRAGHEASESLFYIVSSEVANMSTLHRFSPQGVHRKIKRKILQGWLSHLGGSGGDLGVLGSHPTSGFPLSSKSASPSQINKKSFIKIMQWLLYLPSPQQLLLLFF